GRRCQGLVGSGHCAWAARGRTRTAAADSAHRIFRMAEFSFREAESGDLSLSPPQRRKDAAFARRQTFFALWPFHAKTNQNSQKTPRPTIARITPIRAFQCPWRQAQIPVATASGPNRGAHESNEHIPNRKLQLTESGSAGGSIKIVGSPASRA